MKNKYLRNSKISEFQFRKLVRLFCERPLYGSSHGYVEEISRDRIKLNEKTVYRYFGLIRSTIVQYVEEEMIGQSDDAVKNQLTTLYKNDTHFQHLVDVRITNDNIISDSYIYKLFCELYFHYIYTKQQPDTESGVNSKYLRLLHIFKETRKNRDWDAKAKFIEFAEEYFKRAED